MSGSSRTGHRVKTETSPSLPSKVYEVQGEVVLLQELLQAGVVEIKGGDGRQAYCFFQVVIYLR